MHKLPQAIVFHLEQADDDANETDHGSIFTWEKDLPKQVQAWLEILLHRHWGGLLIKNHAKNYECTHQLK
jgi:hypothetical protein